MGSVNELFGFNLPPAAIFPLLVVVFLLLAFSFAKRYRKVGPNEVMIISGLNHTVRNPDGSKDTVGYRIRAGGGAFIFPLFEKVDVLSLEIMTLDVNTPEVYTAPGVPLIVDGVAQIKVRGDEQSIRTAAEQFLGKTGQQIQAVALQTVEGHLRAIVGTLTVEEIYRNRDQFSARVQEVAVGDLANMGLQIVSFTLRDIRDQHGYLEALGKPKTSEVKRDAIVAQAEADRDATVRAAAARQIAELAKLQAETQIAQAERDYKLKKAEFDGATNELQAKADLAYALQKFKTGQALKKEEVQIAIVEKEQQIAVQEREIQRRQKELEASVMKAADADRYRTETEATANQFKIHAEAKGRAEAERARGLAQADVTRATGTAEADVIKLRGTAEAEIVQSKGLAEAAAMMKKAESYRQYNQAAIFELLAKALPEIAQAIAAPLGKADKITIVSAGDGQSGGGISKFNGDMAHAMAAVPAVLESFAGIDLKQLIAAVPGLAGSPTKPPAGKRAAETEPLSDLLDDRAGKR